MKLTYPYEVELNTKKDAVNYIRHQCHNCPRCSANWDCSGATTAKCIHSINLVVAEFGGKWTYKTGKENCDVTNGHSSYYDVFITDSEKEAIKIAKEKHNDFLIRIAKIGEEELEQTYSVKEGWL